MHYSAYSSLINLKFNHLKLKFNFSIQRPKNKHIYSVCKTIINIT